MKGYLAGIGHPVPGFRQMTYLSTYAPPAYQVPTQSPSETYESFGGIEIELVPKLSISTH
jgi:hypothetical protein